MNLSISLCGVQNAQNSFDTAASAIAQRKNTTAESGQPMPSDVVDLSTPVVDLLLAQNSFTANLRTMNVEDRLTRSTLSLVA